MFLYPLKFIPIYKRRIWGGQKLREIFAKDIPPFEKIGESWELVDLTDDKSEIENGDLAGQTISSVIASWPLEITGREDFTGPFPLLIKFLDAEDTLSVQVHPDSQTCQKLGFGQPKSEYWYIVSAAPDAFIYKGLKNGVTKTQLAKAVKKGNVADLLEKVSVKAGQFHFLPAGTAHAIGAGILIAEIQPPSDTTFRLFDWNRTDEFGKTRQINIEHALESIHFDSSKDHLTFERDGTMVRCEYFTVDKTVYAKDSELSISSGQMKTLVFLSGFGKLLSINGFPVDFKAGDTILVPACFEGKISFAADTEFLTVTV